MGLVKEKVVMSDKLNKSFLETKQKIFEDLLAETAVNNDKHVF